MGLTSITYEDLDKEKEILCKLFECSKDFKSVIFNSGAGSGKTYALIECLKFIISRNRENLKNHNQKIACITYTNVAADHIKTCLGNSDIVDVSTIHERIWSVIKNQKEALLSLHIEKIKKEIDNINNQLENKDYIKYKELNESEQACFFDIMYKNRAEYNKIYNYSASDFRNALPQEICSKYAVLLSNVNKFKTLVNILFKRKKLIDCLIKINNKEKKYIVVNYDAMYNRDRLEKMRISHDTLLEYGYLLFERFPRMRQLLIDQYPYILIDECQDTADCVVKIMNLVDSYAKELRHNMFIAYFGDSVQNIYDTGVGARLKDLHKDLLTVSKLYNRRSYEEIIKIANKIRKDEIVQKSIFQDCKGGSFKIYYGNKTDVKRFIELCAKKWNAKTDNSLHCLFGTNQMVAEYSGFLNLFYVFKNSDMYKGDNYKQLNTELLSHDTIRLGKIQSILYRLIKLYIEVREKRQPLKDILSADECRNMSFSDLKTLIQLLQSLKGNTLGELLFDIFDKKDKEDNTIYNHIMERVFDIEDMISYDGVLKFISSSLCKISDESIDKNETINALLNMQIEEILKWFHYVNRDEKKEICYHTFHSTKGLEYENVVIILEKGFGIDRDIFKDFFKNYGNESNQLSMKYEKARNILYVTVTRAIKNLRILYIDDIEEVRDDMERIFEIIYSFSDKVTYDMI